MLIFIGDIAAMVKNTLRRVKKFKPAGKFGSKELAVIAFIGIFGVIGSLALIFSHAASFTGGFEPEDGNKSTNIAVVTDTGAAGGRAIKFPSAGQSAFQFSEDFSVNTAFAARFDHGWSGELHAGALFGADKNGWPGDHDMNCGNPNMTHRTITMGGGNNDSGQSNPAAAEPAFYSCIPGDDPAKGHVMTSANTEGYVIAWFSPKQVFTDVRKVCYDNNFTYQGNGEWWQLIFLTPNEYNRKPDGVLDLGFTSPDFRGGPIFGGPSTIQSTAEYGVKFLMNSDDGFASTASLSYQAWVRNPDSSAPPGMFVGNRVGAGPSTTDKAPRYQICTTDNNNGTLTVVNASPNGQTYTQTIAGEIPNGQIRVVLEHDEYNPDKHHSNAGPVGDNAGEGYTYHWDNVTVQ